jgi:hypothetical protein
VHPAPLAALAVPHAPAVHTGIEHAVPVVGQSPGVAQSTQWPTPSQTLPPFSAHGAPAAPCVVTQALPVQAMVVHTDTLAGQSPSFTQPTQWP